eukprot:TRINITY_DN78866_c0_g1_i1.p2 TRINITY_DN78866_c0_g1~~TRINITY_DN78866_c0_g1_i1.p2  ORF type:complete len:160 (-),score=13.18 TRINITY_DN78866_c0_g1_i1:499-978(-)
MLMIQSSTHGISLRNAGAWGLALDGCFDVEMSLDSICPRSPLLLGGLLSPVVAASSHLLAIPRMVMNSWWLYPFAKVAAFTHGTILAPPLLEYIFAGEAACQWVTKRANRRRDLRLGSCISTLDYTCSLLLISVPTSPFQVLRISVWRDTLLRLVWHTE